VPPEQQIAECIVLHKGSGLSILAQLSREADIGPRFDAGLGLQAQGFLLIDIFVAVPLRQLAEDALQKPGKVLGFAHSAGEDQGSEAVLVEQTIIERHELEVWRLTLVKELDHPEAVFGVDGR